MFDRQKSTSCSKERNMTMRKAEIFFLFSLTGIKKVRPRTKANRKEKERNTNGKMFDCSKWKKVK